MDAKRLRLAKWKQAQQAKNKSGESAQNAQLNAQNFQLSAQSAQPSTQRSAQASFAAPDALQRSAPSPSSPVKLNLAHLRRKRGPSARRPLDWDENSTRPDDERQEAAKPQSSVAQREHEPSAQSNESSAQSLDDVIDSLGASSSVASGAAAYPSEDSDSGSEQSAPVPRKKAKSATSKLDTVVADHSLDVFEKQLFKPSAAAPIDAEAFRLANGIKLDGSDVAPISQWHAAGLPLPLLRTVEARGFAAPTSIQAQALPVIMSGSDLVGIAPTSSGKTMAFLLPLCRHVAANRAQHRKMSRGPYAVVLAPTRELCLQIFREAEPLASSMQLKALGCYGGTDISSQIAELIGGRCDIIVATPGRLIDLLATNHGRVLSLRGVTFLVVDETDRMFDLGFGPQVRTIVGAIRPDRQTVVFSATMSPGMEALVSRILTRPARITVGEQATVPPQITQEAVLVEDRRDKLPLLARTLDSVEKDGLAIVFVETQERADAVTLQLLAKGYRCQALHGGMDQQDRSATIAEFRQGQLPVLVATSIAARGLDVRNVKLVVNYDAASHLEDYVHRAGRTGRGGNDGRCLSLLEPHQSRHAHELSRLFALPNSLQKMALEFSQSSGASGPPRLGFGGHGLANLEKKRDFKKAVEQDAYAPELDSQEPESAPKDDTQSSETHKSLIFKEGNSFAARLPINDAAKEARVAVTAAGNLTRISADFAVSITIRGTFFPRPTKDIAEERKLHLLIEGEREDSVSRALASLTELIDETGLKQGGRYTVL